MCARRQRLADELSAELAADSPDQAALARATFREDEGEFRRQLEILGDDLHTAIGNVRDHAVSRQTACPELDLSKAPANTTFTSTTVRQHLDYPLRCPRIPTSQRFYKTILGIC